MQSRSRVLFLLAFALLKCHSFVPTTFSHQPRAFVTTSNMSPTRQQNEWELPDGVPGDRSSSTSLPSHEVSDTRRERLQREASLKQKFVTGDDLHDLRQHVMSLREELQQARQLGATRRTRELQKAIFKVQQVDAEFVYSLNLERMRAAEQEGRTNDYERYHEIAMEARSALPQYNLDGLWVGKYGNDLYEMINVTYVGDTLIAYKVTGHSTVPSGQVSFQADLSPSLHYESLDPIELGEAASQQWGTKYLPRYEGQGQVASKGFTNSQFVDGQLILVNEYFSFAWIPLGHQVFFGRPSAELTLKMLKERDAPQSQAEENRAHLARCLEETVILQEEAEEDECESFYSMNQHDYYNQEGCFE